jgi:hypothetical protein
VSFDIEPHGAQVKLTVIHDDFDPDSTVLRLVSEGWPIKLANLKTGLEQTSEILRSSAVGVTMTTTAMPESNTQGYSLTAAHVSRICCFL